jgi:hypothetical protein
MGPAFSVSRLAYQDDSYWPQVRFENPHLEEAWVWCAAAFFSCWLVLGGGGGRGVLSAVISCSNQTCVAFCLDENLIPFR